MAEVTGSIGNEQVALNNAATEATLRLLLQATMSANKQTIESVSKIATKAGLDPAAVTAANSNLRAVGETSKVNTGLFYKLGVGTGVVAEGFKKLDDAISPMIAKFMDGTDKASDIFGQLGRLGGPIGLVADQFARLARFQEENLKTYQQLSQTGVNFNGSLTDMRMAAQNSYMTLDEFSRVMKANSQTFANLGGTVNGGAMAFTNLSNSLLKSESGTYLRNLGYTSEQVNQGLASYLTATGGRNKQEMRNTEQLVKGATEYMGQLQGLADLTGQNREDLDKEMKERAKNASWEAKLAQMSPEEKDKAVRGMANALAVGGKGAADAFQSKVMGVPPITKEAQMFTATMGKTNESVMRSAKNVTDGSKTLDDQNKEYVKGVRANQEDMKKFPLELQFALGASNAEAGKQLNTSQALATRSKKLTDKEYEDALNQAAKEKALKESEAGNAVKTQQAVQEMGQAIMSALMPVIKLLTPVMNTLVRTIGFLLEKFIQFKEVTFGLTAALLAWWAMEKAKAVMERVNAAKGAGGKGLLGGLGVGGALGNIGALGSKTNPMYVIIVSGAAGAGGIADALGDHGKSGEHGSDGKGGSKGGGKARMAKTLLKGGAGLVGGMALDYAGDKLTESGHPQLGAAAGIGSAALSGASTGAMIGSLAGPLGTAIGGALGGVIGGGMSAYQNWGTLTGKEVPKHAEGGIATKPTMGIFGEAGPEALIPLNKFSAMAPKMTDAAIAFAGAGMPKQSSPMDKIGEMLGKLGPLAAMGPLGLAGNAVSSMLGGSSSKGGGTESLTKEIETLNKNTTEMLKQLKEIADHTKQGVSATKSLGGDLFKF